MSLSGKVVGIANSLIVGTLERLGVTVGGVYTPPSPSTISVTVGTGTPRELTSIESGSFVDNTGTTVKAAATLPSAATGLRFHFRVTDADGLRIVANTGDDIRMGDITSATAGYFESVRVGSSVELVATGDTTWQANAVTGVWRADSTTSAGFAFTPTPRTAYTPTGLWVSNTTYTGVWWQTGNVLHLEAKVATSGAPTSANLTIDFPDGYTSAADMPVGGTGFALVGFGWVNDSGSAHAVVYAWAAAEATHVVLIYPSNFTTGWNNVNASQPITWGAGDTLTLTLAVPVA